MGALDELQRQCDPSTVERGHDPSAVAMLGGGCGLCSTAWPETLGYECSLALMFLTL